MLSAKNLLILLKKEFKIEFRQQNALFSLLLYIGGTVFTCFLSFYLKTQQIDSITWNSFFWIVQLFVAFNAISKSFSGESANRNYYYYYIVAPELVILSKIIYNFIMMLIYSGLTLLFFQLFLQIEIGNYSLFMLNMLLGSLGFASTLTMIAGISSRTKNNLMMSVLGIPVMFPMLLLLIKVNNHALDGLETALIYGNMLGVLAINLIVIAASYVLFPYLWRA